MRKNKGCAGNGFATTHLLKTWRDTAVSSDELRFFPWSGNSSSDAYLSYFSLLLALQEEHGNCETGLLPRNLLDLVQRSC
jgi:hypothetical protein